MTGLSGTFCSGLLTIRMVRLVMSTPSSLSSPGEAMVVRGEELRDMTSDCEELAKSCPEIQRLHKAEIGLKLKITHIIGHSLELVDLPLEL